MATKVEQQAQRATRLYGALNALTQNGAERAELRAAGVAESQLASLYPFDAHDVLAVLRAQVKANGLHRWASPNFQWSNPFTYWARRAEMSPELWAEFCALRDSLSGWQDLPADLRKDLLYVTLLRKHPATHQLVAKMAMSFWEACWLEAHVDQMADPARIHARFLEVMLRLAPALKA